MFKYVTMGVLTVAALGIMLFSTVDAFAARRTRVNVNVNNNAAVVRVNNPGFRNDAVVKVFNANAVFHPGVDVVTVRAVPAVNIHGVNGFNTVRFNAFGTRTVADGFGNVFQVDAFGNSVLVGNRGGFNHVGGFAATKVVTPAGVVKVKNVGNGVNVNAAGVNVKVGRFR